MNEKELREQWSQRYNGPTPFTCESLADWWLARIKERDERLKEKIIANGFEVRTKEVGLVEVVAIDDIINLFDNHA